MNLARQELNAAAIWLLLHSNQQNRANFKSKELEPIDITSERVIINPLNPFSIQHRVL